MMRNATYEDLLNLGKATDAPQTPPPYPPVCGGDVPDRPQAWRGPCSPVGEGHRVAMPAEQLEGASLAFCADCGIRVKDHFRATREGPCVPIQVGDSFASIRGLSATAVERRGLVWVVEASDGALHALLPSELAGDVDGWVWTRRPRAGARDQLRRKPEIRDVEVASEATGQLFSEYHRVEGHFDDRSRIEGVIREDARLHPEFAQARRAAVLADLEVPEGRGRRPERGVRDVERLLRKVHRYEAVRGGRRLPGPEAARMVEGDVALAAYERARSSG